MRNTTLLALGAVLIVMLISPGCTAPSPANVTATPVSTATPADNLPASTPTPPVNCGQCHGNLTNRSGHDSANQNCQECHVTKDVHLKHQNATGVSCMSCHKFHS